jgi:hypothetical protein
MAISLAAEAALAGDYPSLRFNQRERKLLESVKDYADSIAAATIITSQGDLIVGDSGGDAIRLAKGSSGLPLVAGASTVSYAALTGSGLAAGAVSLAKLATGISPSHVVKFVSTGITGSTLSGVLTDDICVQIKVADGTVYWGPAVADNTVPQTLASGDLVIVLRPAS